MGKRNIKLSFDERVDYVNSQLNSNHPGIVPNAVYITEEAAALLRCQSSTIRKARRLGKIKANGRPLRILGSELLKLALGGLE